MSLLEVREKYFHIPKSKQEPKVFGQETVAEWMDRTGKRPEQIAPGASNWTSTVNKKRIKK